MHFLLLPYLFLTGLYIYSLDKKDSKDQQLYVWFSMVGMVTLLFLTFSFGLRGGDRWGYSFTFERVRQYSFSEIFIHEELELFWGSFTWGIGQLTEFFELYFAAVMILMLFNVYLSFKLLLNNMDRWGLMISYTLYPFFLNYATNTLRQGMGQSFVMLALALWFTNRRLLGFVVLIQSYFWHSSMAMPIPIILGLWFTLRFRITLKVVVVVYISSIIMSVLRINDALASFIPKLLNLDEKQMWYFDETLIEITGYQTGAKPGFILFSLLPLGVYFVLKKHMPEYKEYQVRYWLSTYCMTNCLLHWFTFAPYSDRFAGMSWFLLPLALWHIVDAAGEEYKKRMFIAFPLFNVLLIQIYTGSFLREFL
ncbi:MAG: EpsG family protein [Fibrobacterales bacterium]